MRATLLHKGIAHLPLAAHGGLIPGEAAAGVRTVHVVTAAAFDFDDHETCRITENKINEKRRMAGQMRMVAAMV
jgi:hypothetical protein